ncbi:MAG TPA: hypothetical protein VKX28_26715 [Xanthobacteraceae bacterium]|nr:hypothetical protein [Xanthobacteraceae bacterium]
MSYDYVMRAYGVNPRVGERVRHKVTEQEGTISRENRSQSHYVMVRFDGTSHPLPCHPTELEYLRVRA